MKKRAKVTYYTHAAYVSGSKNAVLTQVDKLLAKGYELRDNSKVNGTSEKADCWLIHI